MFSFKPTELLLNGSAILPILIPELFSSVEYFFRHKLLDQCKNSFWLEGNLWNEDSYSLREWEYDFLLGSENVMIFIQINSNIFSLGMISKLLYSHWIESTSFLNLTNNLLFLSRIPINTMRNMIWRSHRCQWWSFVSW